MPLLDSTARNVNGASLRLSILGNLRGGQPAGFIDLLLAADLGAPPEQSAVVLGNDTCPAVYWARKGNRVYIFVDGISFMSQGVAIYNAYKFTPVTVPMSVENGYYVAASQAMKAAFVAAGAAPFWVYLTGWSAGGAIAWYYIDRLKEMFGNAFNRTVVTFGSPKAFGGGNEDGYTARQVGDSCSWMNYDDPVPLFPPNITWFESFGWNLSVRELRNLQGYRTYPEGINLDSTFHTVPGTRPQGISLPGTASLSTWLQQQATGVANGHSLSTYMARFAAAQALYPVAAAVRPAQAVPPREPALTPARLHVIEDRNAQTAFQDAKRQNSQPVTIPPAELFVAKRTGVLWGVFFGNKQVAIAPYKRRARGLARIGNEFIRRLQNEAVVNASDLAAQWVEYLSLAADPTSGFVPTLNTQL